MVGSKGSVSLDARFDVGYFCTVRVGRHEFKGTQGTVWQGAWGPGRRGRGCVNGHNFTGAQS